MLITEVFNKLAHSYVFLLNAENIFYTAAYSPN